jgi:hypothetical protein
MTVGELISRLQNYPPTYEVLIELKAQEDIFTTFDLVFSGEFRSFKDEQFDGSIGEIVNSNNRNCVGLMRKKEVRK